MVDTLQQTDEAPTEWEVTEAMIEAALDAIAGGCLAEVTVYDAAQQKVSVCPVVRGNVDGDIQSAITIVDVPVKWPGGGGNALTFPLAAGDVGYMGPLKIDHDRWISGGSTGQGPATRRRDAAFDAVFIPAVKNFVAPLPSGAVSAQGPVWFVTSPFGFLGDSTAAEFIPIASKILAELQAIKAHVDGLTVLPGSFTTPSGPVTGVSGPPVVAMPAPGSVASDKWKIDK